MVKAHQQAWAWQDEWVDLTMDDIRRIEFETQEYLRRRMAPEEEQEDVLESNKENLHSNTGNDKVDSRALSLSTVDANHTLASTCASQVVDFNIIDKDNDNVDSLQFEVPKNKKNSISQYSLAPSHFSKDGFEEQLKRKSAHWSRSNSRSTLHSPGDNYDVISAWRMQSLARDSESSSDEFFDAEGTAGHAA